VIIVWNPNGLLVINVFSKGIKINIDHHITDVLTPLAEWRKTHIDRTDRKLLVYTDNALSHLAKKRLDFLEQNEIKKSLHPPHSPDLTPSDFYFFGHVKQLFTGHKFPDRVAPLDAVQDILRVLKKLRWIGFFSLGWRDSSDLL
jgi:hypothetical protein